MKSNVVSIDLIKVVAKGLGDLNDKAVFVGGATLPFYLPPHMHGAARPTEDIDLVVEIMRSKDRGGFESELRKLGFKNDDSDGAPICRWIYRDISVDIMSPDEGFMGFTNKWYRDGTKHSISKNVGGINIRILAVHYFLATKIEAFKGRGDHDFLASPDIEDIITVLDGSEEHTLLLCVSKADKKRFFTKCRGTGLLLATICFHSNSIIIKVMHSVCSILYLIHSSV